jgi:hypothetical protein
MAWYKFDSLNDFNAWHENIKEELGYPKISVDIEGDEIPEATITDAYTQPFIVSNDDVRAMVEIDHSIGLTLSENPYKDERHEANTL